MVAKYEQLEVRQDVSRFVSFCATCSGVCSVLTAQERTEVQQKSAHVDALCVECVFLQYMHLFNYYKNTFYCSQYVPVWILGDKPG